MKILITGDFGFITFIGSNLAQKFEKEQYKLIILTKSFTKKKKIFKNSYKYTKKIDVWNFLVSNKKLKSLEWKLKITINDWFKKTLKHFNSKYWYF